jgi:hypothetical protein
MLEEELRAPVNAWLREKGMEPFNEYRICWRIPDVVGIRRGRIEMAVEMKLHDCEKALRQASMYTMFAVRSYVAMPSFRQGSILRRIRCFRERGIGAILIREDGTVMELISSGEHQGAFCHAVPPLPYQER